MGVYVLFIWSGITLLNKYIRFLCYDNMEFIFIHYKKLNSWLHASWSMYNTYIIHAEYMYVYREDAYFDCSVFRCIWISDNTTTVLWMDCIPLMLCLDCLQLLCSGWTAYTWCCTIGIIIFYTYDTSYHPFSCFISFFLLGIIIITLSSFALSLKASFTTQGTIIWSFSTL